MGNEVEGGRRCRRKDCAAARDALAQAEMRIAQLDAEVVALHAELSEALKGLELANAEVKRFKQAMADVEPHRPERTPPQQLLLGWRQCWRRSRPIPPTGSLPTMRRGEHLGRLDDDLLLRVPVYW